MDHGWHVWAWLCLRPPPPCIGAITCPLRGPLSSALLEIAGPIEPRRAAPVRSLPFPCWDSDVAALV